MIQSGDDSGRLSYLATPVKTRRPLLSLPPSPALLALLALAFVLPGLFGHDPWKSFDAIGIEIVHQMHLSGDWLVPRVAGEPWLEDPPLFHWIALALARFASLLLPFHDAVRVASGLAVLAACGFLYLAVPRRPGEDTRTEAASAALLLIGTIGLMVHAHEAITDLATLAACSAALAALARANQRPVAMGLGFGVATGLAFLSTGFVTPLALFGAALLGAAACTDLRNRRVARFLAIALIVMLGIAASWPLALRAHSPALFALWLGQATAAHGGFAANLDYFLGISVWFLWPLWPLAFWTVWAQRRLLLSSGLFVPLAAFVLLFAGAAFLGPRQDINLLATLPPLILFAAHGLPTLRRGAASAFDWFGVMTFAFFSGLIIWVGYIAMMTGWPPKIANNFAKLAPGFVPQFAWLPFIAALALTVLWLVLVLRLAPAPSRSATRWAAGVVLLWGTFATLWMPWADHLKTYRGVAMQLREKLPSGKECVAGRNFGAPQRAALSYHAGVRILPPRSESRCRYLVIQGSPKHERDSPGRGWTKLGEFGRAGDKSERYRLYRKDR